MGSSRNHIRGFGTTNDVVAEGKMGSSRNQNAVHMALYPVVAEGKMGSSRNGIKLEAIQ